jgi:chromosome segregation ATPase
MRVVPLLLLAMGQQVGAKLAVSRSKEEPPTREEALAKINASPIRKVITLIEDMKATCEKEGSMDLEAYDKYMCWCETNEKEKTQAIADAEAKIAELTAFIEESVAKEGQLKSEIAALEEDIAQSTEALQTATAQREKEHDEFLGEEADMKETRGLLIEAINTLSAVQLLQVGRASSRARRNAQKVLAQISDVVGKRFPKYQNVMQRDLFDVLGSFNNLMGRDSAPDGAAFLGERSKLLPWEKTEEQLGMEKKPNELEGAVAGVKSYNARSGRILGILEEMLSEFTRDLSAIQKADFEEEVAFQKLRAAKLAEIAAATEQKERKEEELAEVMRKMVEAKEDLEATENALAADQKFLAELQKGCKEEDEEYKARVAVRSEEIRTLGEALKILTSDDARELYSKTMTFVQTGQRSRRAKSGEQQLVEQAVQQIIGVARKHKDWAMVSLAVRAKLDSFTKVKELMDKMLVELEKQQKEEYEKWEFCQKSIDKTEDDIKVATRLKEDLADKHQDLVNTIETLEAEIAALKVEVADMEVSLKQAGEERHEANRLYQSSVMDQRATINVMNKALTRLQMFYNNTEFVQEPGRASSPAPPKPSGPEAVGYEKSGLSGGVIDLLMKVIENAQATEKELSSSEQAEQADYASFVTSAKESIEADRASIQLKEGQVAEAQAAKSETEEAQLANDADLDHLGELLHGYHLECDYLLKYFDVRQKARAEEMSAIQEAKAILSGANYGR